MIFLSHLNFLSALYIDAALFYNDDKSYRNRGGLLAGLLRNYGAHPDKFALRPWW